MVAVSPDGQSAKSGSMCCLTCMPRDVAVGLKAGNLLRAAEPRAFDNPTIAVMLPFLFSVLCFTNGVHGEYSSEASEQVSRLKDFRIACAF